MKNNSIFAKLNVLFAIVCVCLTSLSFASCDSEEDKEKVIGKNGLFFVNDEEYFTENNCYYSEGKTNGMYCSAVLRLYEDHDKAIGRWRDLVFYIRTAKTLSNLKVGQVLTDELYVVDVRNSGDISYKYYHEYKSGKMVIKSIGSHEFTCEFLNYTLETNLAGSEHYYDLVLNGAISFEDYYED